MMQQIRDMEKYEEGKKEGIDIGISKIIKNLLKKYSPEQVVEMAGITLEEVLEIKNK